MKPILSTSDGLDKHRFLQGNSSRGFMEWMVTYISNYISLTISYAPFTYHFQEYYLKLCAEQV